MISAKLTISVLLWIALISIGECCCFGPVENFRSYNFPRYGMGIRFRNQGYIVDGGGGPFHIDSPGLAGIPGSISLESVSHPGHYLRHQNFLLFVHPFSNQELYKNDATFMPRRGRFFAGYTAFESVNYCNRFIRHQGYRLKLHQDDGSELFHKDASFRQMEATHWRTGPMPIQSQNYPSYSFGIQNVNQAFIVADNDEQFHIVSPGLEGTPRSLSFESASRPNHYLRHQGYNIYLHEFAEKNSALYKEDATFMPLEHIFYKGYTTFESINFPGYFIRHQNYRLKISREIDTELLRKDASFVARHGAPTDGGPFYFNSYNFPTYFIGIQNNAEGFIVNDGQDRFRLISPGLSGTPGSVSFQSVSHPGQYLRHQNNLIYRHPFQNADLYKNDATFMPRPDEFYTGYVVYESVNFPGHYIRHQNYRLKISVEDNSELLHKDASFAILKDKDEKKTCSLPPYSYNFPTYPFGIINNNQAFIVKGEGRIFNLVSPGLAGVPGSVSLESIDHPNHFLRHSGYLLYLHPFADENLYKNDATFMPRRDLFYEGYTAFESVNFPNYYIPIKVTGSKSAKRTTLSCSTKMPVSCLRMMSKHFSR